VARSLKLSCLNCLFLVVLLFFPLGSIALATNDGNVIFYEDFNDSTLDMSTWMVQENTNLSRYPAWGGAIALNDSCVWLSSEGSVFPWINTIANPFPSSGDFAVTWKLTYTTIADWGDGFIIYCPPHADPSNPYKDRVLTLWAGDHGPDATSIYIELFGYGVWDKEVPGFRPTSEAHLYRLEYRQGTYTVYVDGTAVASQRSQVRPDGIGIGHPPVNTLPNSPESTQMWAYWGWTSSKTDYVQVETFEGNGDKSRPSEITMSTSTATQNLGYKIDISGALSSEGNPISDAKIHLYYAIAEDENWNAITATTTDLNGAYSASWLPTATGLFTLKAEYSGSENSMEAEVSKNISVLQIEREREDGFFFVESNSTLTSLNFNSKTNEISFTVGGPSGTTGYVKFAVPKALVPDFWALKVFLDGRQIEYSFIVDGDSLILSFQYSHSMHDIVISVPQNSTGDSSFPIVSIAVVALALAAPLAFVMLFRKNSRTRSGLTEETQK